MNYNSFSQKDTTQISLNNQTAKLVIKDLIKGDGCIKELEQSNLKILKLEERDIQKEEKIQTLIEKNNIKDKIIIEKDLNITILKEDNYLLQEELQESNNKKKFWKTTTIIGGILLVIILV